MKEYNKKNLMFLCCIFACLLAVIFTVIFLFYIKEGWWSTIIPIVFEIFGIYNLIKIAIKFKKDSEIKK